MDVFEILGQKQAYVFKHFKMIKHFLRHKEVSMEECLEIYCHEVNLIDEMTSYLNLQLTLFSQLSEIGYEEIVKPMFIYRFDVRQLLLLLHEHQENYESPDYIFQYIDNYRTEFQTLYDRFRACVKKDNSNYSSEFQNILTQIKPFHSDFFEQEM